MTMMRIAAVTEDGETISQHFGRAPFYEVVTVEGDKVIGRERRDKLGHAHFVGEAHGAEGQESGGHGLGPEAETRHARMAAAIADCQVLLAGGMGTGAYQSLVRSGVRPILTDIQDIGRAVQAVISGEIVDHPERVH